MEIPSQTSIFNTTVILWANSRAISQKKKCSLILRQAEWCLELTSELVTHKFQKELTSYYVFILTCSQTGLFSLRTRCPSQSSVSIANKFIYHNS